MNRFSDRLITLLVAGTIILIILTAFSSGGMQRKDVNKPVPFPPTVSLRSGDLIFRNGRGMISNAFRLASLKQPLYSHAGIIHWQGKKCMVIHVIDGKGEMGKVRMEPIEQFCNTSECSSFGIYRTNLSPSAIDKNALAGWKSSAGFDAEFDLGTDDKMYCTELVYKILRRSSDTFFIPLSKVSGREYVACDDLFLAPGNKLIYAQSY